MDTRMRWTHARIVGPVLGAGLGLEWLIRKHEPSEFIILAALLIVLCVMVEEGFEAIWKRLNEIADTVRRDKIAGTEP